MAKTTGYIQVQFSLGKHTTTSLAITNENTKKSESDALRYLRHHHQSLSRLCWGLLPKTNYVGPATS